ncbi:hypothetical protein DPMN_029751 [Dreissena polymorpha]|uniref:Uncharacterized protein n=1 Tax=Dreissena polymorpha TaxID=45954 RepID=A0A9D4RGI4_DREPO|nr:hypothetical protein DPMN_029751 [Dreissena polymorpha]
MSVHLSVCPYIRQKERQIYGRWEERTDMQTERQLHERSEKGRTDGHKQIGIRRYGQTDRKTDSHRRDSRTDGHTEIRTHRRTDGHTNGGTERKTDTPTYIQQTDGRRDRQKDRHTERNTDKETDTRTDGNTDVRTDGHTHDVTISSLTRTECSE